MKSLQKLAFLAVAGSCMAGHVTWAQEMPDEVGINKSIASLKVGDWVPYSYAVSFHPTSSKGRSPVVSHEEFVRANGEPKTPPPFGEHSTGQSKVELAKTLGLKKGRVAGIFAVTNAAHVIMTDEEADMLRKDPRVAEVTRDRVIGLAQSQQAQMYPGWGLDRLDQTQTALNQQYTYSWSGAGQVIYVLDTGLSLSNPKVAAEFGGRASIFHDFNPGGNGTDCHGHGTEVSSVAAGSVHGVAKGATVRAVKVTSDCGFGSAITNLRYAFEWLAANGVRGQIVNLSMEVSNGAGCIPRYEYELDNAIRATYNRGLIVVAGAGNDGCPVASFSIARLPEVFVVGASSNTRFGFNQDARVSTSISMTSRYGSNVAGFAPGQNVATLKNNGIPGTNTGTSFAAPYVAGLFASGCHWQGNFCSTMANPGVAYQALKNVALTGSVVNPNGGPLPAGTPSRLLVRNGW
jgi:subtilisin family serine protease